MSAGKDRRKCLGADALAVGAERRGGRFRHVRDDVVPLARNLGFVEKDFRLRHEASRRAFDAWLYARTAAGFVPSPIRESSGV